jgi:phenylpropionate dioxygenase-like ring-hydroxylating dioxygenase large terminal subunit
MAATAPDIRGMSIAAAGLATGFRPQTLPGWTYDNAEFFELEKRQLLLKSPQLVCHVSEVRNPGDYATLDFLGERAFVIRGADGELRAFHNVCRHRAAAVVHGATGRCDRAIRCFYHGWVYDLDGRLKALPAEATFARLDRADFGLKPLEMEIYLGFVFVRFAPGGESVAARLVPYRDELAAYRPEQMVPTDRIWDVNVPVDWKNVMDNYLEGYHVPVGHPGLYRLFGNSYEVDTRQGNVARAIGWLRDKESANWSERHYQRLRPEVAYLPEPLRKSWRYYKLLPNLAFDVYPEQMDFFQVIPVAPGKARLRGRMYALPSNDRRMNAARWLSSRVNVKVFEEDNALIESVQAGLGTSAYGQGYFSEKEICLRQFHDMIRAAVPVAARVERPAPGTVAAENARLAGGN